MSKTEHSKLNLNVFLLPFLWVLTLWVVYWIEYNFSLNFNHWGIYPRTWRGLRGIFFSPFIHSGPQHIFNNSTPLFVLTAVIFYFYRKIFFKFMFIGWLLTGLMTWIIARPAYHIGASGLIYMMISFVFFSGVIRKYYKLVAVSLVIVFLYGSMIWYILPIQSGISWEGHLSGFLVGIVLAYLFRHQGPQKQEYVFRRTAFDDYFDEEGNFIGPSQEEAPTSDTMDHT